MILNFSLVQCRIVILFLAENKCISNTNSLSYQTFQCIHIMDLCKTVLNKFNSISITASQIGENFFCHSLCCFSLVKHVQIGELCNVCLLILLCPASNPTYFRTHPIHFARAYSPFTADVNHRQWPTLFLVSILYSTRDKVKLSISKSKTNG